MNEIEKLYENAGVGKQAFCSCTDTCYNGSLSECEGRNAYKYPNFTADKQLELIKWLSEEAIYINHAEGKYFIFTMNIGGSECSKDFDTSLAKYINLIWQDLTEEERKQIKEILSE